MIYLAVIIAAMLACAGSGYQGWKMGIDSQIAKQAKADQSVRDENQHIAEAVDAANNVLAHALAKMRPQYTTIKQELQREINTNTVYSACVLPDGGLQRINQALAGAPTVPASSAAGGGKLPEAKPPGG